MLLSVWLVGPCRRLPRLDGKVHLEAYELRTTMHNLLSMAVLLIMVFPQHQNLPDEFHRIPKQLGESATIIIAGTYGEGRTPCQWLPDGSREWFKDSWFEVKRVYRGKVESRSIRINTEMLPVNGYVRENLEEARDYLVLLRPGEDKIEGIKTGTGLSFWDALHGDEIIAIVELASDAQGGEMLRQDLASIDFSRASVAVANAGKGKASDSSFVEISKGFRLASVEGCTIVLRNEGIDRRAKYVYEVIIPLAELNAGGEVTDPSPEEITDRESFGNWKVLFRTKDGQRSVVLDAQGRKRLSARGAHMWFGLDNHQAAENFLENFQRVIQKCANNRR